MIIAVGTESFYISDAQQKALYWDIYELRDWIENAIKVKISQLADEIIINNTDKNPCKMTYSDKLSEITNMSAFAPGSTISITLNLSGIANIDLSEIETGILELNESGLKELIQDFVIKKAKSCIDRIVKTNTEERIEALNDTEKETIVNNATIKSAKQRQEAFEASL